MRNRNVRIQIYLTDDEFAILQNKVVSTGLKREAYIRSVLNDRVPKEAPPAEYYELIRQVRHVGNNLNQLLKKSKHHRFYRCPTASEGSCGEPRNRENAVGYFYAWRWLMATTAIWGIKGRVDHVIDYVKNPAKTTLDMETAASFHAVDDVIEYTADEMKTEKLMFVNGINCDADIAARQFMTTKRHWSKTDGNVCYHGYQSFRENEVDAATAHEIGMKLAQELWGDRFEVVVTTHLNTDNYHNHFVLNSVSFTDGKKYNDCRATYHLMRDTSDRLCRDYELSVIENPGGKAKHYAEWKAEQNGEYTLRGGIREAIDIAIKGSINQSQFFDAMKQMGYIIDQSGKHAKIKHIGSDRFVRFKSLGSGYMPEEILNRVYANTNQEFPDLPTQESPAQIFKNAPDMVTFMGYRPLYKVYVRGLLVMKERPSSNRRMNFLLREDLQKLDSYIAQSELLAKNHIDTAEQLAEYKVSVKDEITQLCTSRADLRNELKRVTRIGDEPQIQAVKENISACSGEIKKRYGEIKLCDKIAERSGIVRERLLELEKPVKGRDTNEHDIQNKNREELVE